MPLIDPNVWYEKMNIVLSDISQAIAAVKKSSDAQTQSADRMERMTRWVMVLTVVIAVLALVSAAAVVMPFLPAMQLHRAS